MNKTFIALALFGCMAAQAQVHKGQIMVGGNFNYNTSEASSKPTTNVNQESGSEYSGFGIGIQSGYMITDHVMLGISGNYSDYSSTNYIRSVATSNEFWSTQKTQSFSAGVFSRYYKMLGESRFALYGQLGAYYGAGKGKYNVDDAFTPSSSSSDFTTVSAGINPGIIYFISKKVAVETAFGNVGYSYKKEKVYDKDKKPTEEKVNSGFSSSLNFSLASLYLGINFYF